MPHIGKYNKTIYTEADKHFVRDNYLTMTNPQLARALGVGLTSLRTLLYSELGLKRMEMEYWTEEMVTLLKENYQTSGDTEIAEMLTPLFPKKKGWHKRHIEKKRRYLGLKRTEEETKSIHARNIALGKYTSCAVKMWETRGGVSEEGSIKHWIISRRPVAMIKVKGTYVHAGRHLWEQANGPVPKGHIVSFKDQDATNLDLDNLELLPKAESHKHLKNSDNYIAALIGGKKDRDLFVDNKPLLELKRKQLLLNGAINQKTK